MRLNYIAEKQNLGNKNSIKVIAMHSITVFKIKAESIDNSFAFKDIN